MKDLTTLLQNFNNSLKDGSMPSPNKPLFSFRENTRNAKVSSEYDEQCKTQDTNDREGKFITCFTDYIKDRRSFILDLSYLLYYGYFRSGSQVWKDTQFVVELITGILSHGHEVYIAVDGKPVRKQINKHYKENRKHTYNIRENMPPLLAELSMYNRVHIHYNPELEADDIIFTLNRLLPGKKVIVTSDNDMFQCLGSDTIIDTGKQIVDCLSYMEQFEEKFHKVPIDRLPMYRAIVGDSSDNIKGAIARFPHKLAAQFITSLDMDTSVFPSHESLVVASDAFKKRNKLKVTECRWIDRLLSTDVVVPDKTPKQIKEVQEVLTEDELELLPNELRPLKLSEIGVCEDKSVVTDDHVQDDEDIEPKSSFEKWQENFSLMKLRVYTWDEINKTPKMEFGDMPYEITQQVSRLSRANASFSSLL
jgi:5'-3' exonuclease